MARTRAKGTGITHATNQDHAKQGTTRHDGFACKRRDTHTPTPGEQKRRVQGPSKSTSRDIEARSPLDAIDIITTESQEIENDERQKTGTKAIQIRFFFLGEL